MKRNNLTNSVIVDIPGSDKLFGGNNHEIFSLLFSYLYLHNKLLHNAY